MLEESLSVALNDSEAETLAVAELVADELCEIEAVNDCELDVLDDVLTDALILSVRE